MKTRSKLLIVGASSLALAAAGGGLAFAGGGGEESETPISGTALDRASAAALDHLGGGTVTGTEVGDEESYYEVEVTRGGGEVDVQLDRGFDVVGQESDANDASEGDEQGDN